MKFRIVIALGLIAGLSACGTTYKTPAPDQAAAEVEFQSEGERGDLLIHSFNKRGCYSGRDSMPRVAGRYVMRVHPATEAYFALEASNGSRRDPLRCSFLFSWAPEEGKRYIVKGGGYFRPTAFNPEAGFHCQAKVHEVQSDGSAREVEIKQYRLTSRPACFRFTPLTAPSNKAPSNVSPAGTVSQTIAP